ncbi:MAG: hypothetical protein EXQ49_02170 [Acidobacteria bacterium]|nr:hypothetical protein [Acidobacteriota bacterium]
MTRVFCSTSLIAVAGLLAGLTAAGCSPLGPTTAESSLPNAAISVENFSGSLKVKGVAFYSFSVVDGGTTYLSLLSLKEAGVDSDVLVTIGLGVPRATACVATNVLSVKATGSLQLTGTTNPGVHCAVVFDSGNLTKDATFSLNIARPK